MSCIQHDDEHALCEVFLAAMRDVGPRTHRRLLSAARSPDISLRSLFQWPARRLVSEIGIDHAVARLIARAKDPLARGRKLRTELADEGVRIVQEGEPDYPERLTDGLGRDAPPLLFMAGDPEILSRRTLAVVGSRHPSRTGERAATRFASRMANAGWTVVSGGARGIDTAGHHGALQHGATAVVPPVGIREFRWREPARRRVQGGAWCKVGQFPPDCGWKTEHALMRNHTIVALSDATLAVEPRDRGGTWRSSRATLRAGKPLFVMNGSDEPAKNRGAEALCRSGARMVSCEAPPGPDEFAEIVERSADSISPRQRSLFDSDQTG